VSATPLAEGAKVYALGGNGDVHCLDAAKGTVVWRRDLGGDYQIEKVMCRASPLIEGNLLVAFTGAKPGACVMALDKDTGKEVWKALDEGVTNSSPLVIEAGGKKQLIVWTQQSVTSLDPATGATWWRERVMSTNEYAVSSPVVRKDLLLIGGMMFRLSAEEPAATVLWPQTKAVSRRVLSNTSTAVISRDFVYSAKSSGEFVCLDANSGEQVWQTDKVTDLLSGASIHITLNGDGALLYNERGELIRARLTADGYEELGRAALIEPTYAFAGRKCAWAPPAFANGHVFARSDKEIVCASLAAKP
jgi:outer membrane protein assembly factor BamB